MPQGIQRKRTKGWRLPPNAICVTRPGRWGNPFPEPLAFAAWLESFSPQALAAYLAPLRDKDLACWCPLVDHEGQLVPCHRDVLLRLANREESPLCPPPSA